MTFAEIIECWENRAVLAADLDMPYERVAQWYKRNSIRPKYWAAIVTAAQSRGYGRVTMEALTAAASMGSLRHARSRSEMPRAA